MPDFGDDATVSTPLSLIQGVSPLWRLIVTDLGGTTATVLDRLASDRVVSPLLNGPLVASFSVPSDDARVNIPFPDVLDDPRVAEGNRLAYWFRRESETPPYYTVRASTLIMQVEDSALADDATTRVTAFDPWQYLFYRAMVNPLGDFPGSKGISFDDSMGSYVVPQLLRFAQDFPDTDDPVAVGKCFIDPGETYGGTPFWNGVYETTPTQDWGFAQGLSIGQAWAQVVAGGTCDIILTPVWDPVNRPGILCDLSVYDKAGVTRPGAIFAWDRPGRSVTGLGRIKDGSTRANKMKLYAGVGGSAPDGQSIAVQSDSAAIEKYGEYWFQQFFPTENVDGATALLEWQLFLRKNGRETVTISPAPERAPRPWQDYGLGDEIHPAASRRFRSPIPDGDDPTASSRVYGWTANISDDALETISPLLLSSQVTFS